MSSTILFRYGDKWNKKWAQEAAYIKIHQEIPKFLENHATPADKTAYAQWPVFLNAFLSKGKTATLMACIHLRGLLTLYLLLKVDKLRSLY